MAKKKGHVKGLNKTAEVRDYLAKHPDESLADVVEAMKKRGISVSPSLVSTVTYSNDGKKKVSRKMGARRTKPRGLSAGDLIVAKEFADRVGGLDRAKQALGTLEQLR